MAPGPTRRPVGERLRIAAARFGALVMDALLLAYGTWCVNYLAAWSAGEVGREGWLRSTGGFLGRRPWLLLLAPLVAAAWQATGRSLGQRAWRVRALDLSGREAAADRRAWRGVLALLQAAVVLLPLTLAVLRWREGLEGGSFVLLSGLLLAAFLAVALVDPFGRGLVDMGAGTHTLRLRPGADRSRRAWYRRGNAWVVLALLLLTAAVGFVLTRFEPQELVENVRDTVPMWSRLLSPDWTIAGRVVERLVETVFLALVASGLAIPFAFVLSFLGARNLMGKRLGGRLVYVVTRVLMNVTRSIEPLVWVIIFSLWVGVGPDAGMFALFVHSVAALGKLYSEAIESIDPGPVEAIRATGAREVQVLRYGVVPQVVPPFLAFTVYRWDINVRMATILGLVGGGGIGDLLITYQQLGAWSQVGTILLFVTLVVWAMDWASAKARERLT